MANLNGAGTTSQTGLSNSSSASALHASNAASAMPPVKPLSSLVGSITLPSLSTVSHPVSFSFHFILVVQISIIA